MSNFNKEGCPVLGYESEIIGGSEVVNGTGQVSLEFWWRPGEDPQGYLTLMTADQVLQLAEWLADLAWAAKREQWRERNTLCG